MEERTDAIEVNREANVTRFIFLKFLKAAVMQTKRQIDILTNNLSRDELLKQELAQLDVRLPLSLPLSLLHHTSFLLTYACALLWP